MLLLIKDNFLELVFISTRFEVVQFVGQSTSEFPSALVDCLFRNDAKDMQFEWILLVILHSLS